MKDGSKFDFLNDLQIPYRSEEPGENQPLTSLANQDPFAAEFYASVAKLGRHDSDLASNCPLDLDPASRTTAHIRAHVNKLLTYLDDRYAATGGILSMKPDPATKNTLLSQWLLYTSRLVVRVAELEREVVNLREVLANESLVARVRAHASQNQNGESSAREMLFPQDRYVLAGLNDALWLRISEALSLSDDEAIDRENDTGVGTVRGSGPFRAVTGSGPGSAAGGEQAIYGDVVSWVETNARLYRVRGQETVFVIPAWDMHSGVKAVRAVERGPLVMSLPKMPNSGAGTAAEWRTIGRSAREREAEAETRRLRDEIASLKHDLDQLNDEREDKKRQRRVAEFPHVVSTVAVTNGTGPDDGFADNADLISSHESSPTSSHFSISASSDRNSSASSDRNSSASSDRNSSASSDKASGDNSGSANSDKANGVESGLASSDNISSTSSNKKRPVISWLGY